ncbi:MAG: hypothetical protein IT269_00655 [Saprospiraceae bacterium]|nr:hypothetical protein [Saprospiraceae bacterium]
MISARLHIEKHIANGQLGDALQAFLTVTTAPEHTELRKDILALSARFSHLQDSWRKKLINSEQYEQSFAQISHALSDYATALPADMLLPDQTAGAQAPPKPSPANNGNRWQRWIAILGIVSSIMGIIGVSLKEMLFPSAETNPTTTATISDTRQPAATQVPSGTSEQKQPETKPEPKTTAQTPEKSVKTSPKTETEKPAEAPKTGLPAGYTRSQNPVISEGMEIVFSTADPSQKGFYDIEKQKVICCYDDVQKFRNGKARVSRQGRYFYIDKKGVVVNDE